VPRTTLTLEEAAASIGVSLGAATSRAGSCARRDRSRSSASGQGIRPGQPGVARSVDGFGEVFISRTRLNGSSVPRLAVGNERTTDGDVERAGEVLGAKRGELAWSELGVGDHSPRQPAPSLETSSGALRTRRSLEHSRGRGRLGRHSARFRTGRPARVQVDSAGFRRCRTGASVSGGSRCRPFRALSRASTGTPASTTNGAVFGASLGGPRNRVG
jgi:hypothetical protein